MSEELKTVARVDLARYLGTWYEIARKPMRFEDATARDITATYALEADGAVRVTNSCLDAEGEVDVAEGRAEPVDAGNNAKLAICIRCTDIAASRLFKIDMVKYFANDIPAWDCADKIGEHNPSE